MTFEKACLHITNFTTAHKSRADKLGDERVNYPIIILNQIIGYFGFYLD